MTVAADIGHHIETHTKTVFGFWVYIMTDCILFGCLFATYVVLQGNTFGGPSGKDLFSLPYALGETFFLLTSSFVSGLAMIAGFKGKRGQVLMWLALTLMLGCGFLTMEIMEFTGFVLDGNSWQRSAFLSSFFTLVGTHGTHVTFGSIWIIVLAGQILYKGLTFDTLRRQVCFTIFWHFLDVVWIFIFTVVYLMGAAAI